MDRLRCPLAVLLFLALLSPLFGMSTYFLPQAATGVAGDLRFVTQISIANPGSVPAGAQIFFFNNEGEQWTVTTLCAEDSHLNGPNDMLMFFVPASSKYTISMTSSGGIEVGWVGIKSAPSVAVNATYGLYSKVPELDVTIFEPVWEAAVLPAPAAQELSFSAHCRQDDVIAGTDVNTGYAISNPNSVPVTVHAYLTDAGGQLLETKSFTLPRGGHAAQFINELYDTDLSNFRGTVRLWSTAPIAALAMKEAKWQYGKAIYSTIPVVPNSNFAQTLEYDREPNNTPQSAMEIQAPTEVFGTTSLADNDTWIRDYYSVELKAGQRLELILLAGALGSAVDPILSVRNAQEQTLAESSELFEGARDRRLSYTAPADGNYFIYVSGGNSRRHFYRMFVRVF